MVQPCSGNEGAGTAIGLGRSYSPGLQGDRRARFCDVPPQMCSQIRECPVKPSTSNWNPPPRA
jgi:hypothetical protein